MSNTKYVFGFNEKLPWEYEVVMMILSQAPGGPPSGSAESTTRKDVMSGFVNGIIELWVKAFGEECIQSRKVVRNKIVKLLESYYRDVTTARTSGSKAKVCNRGKSERQIKKQWRESHNKLFCILKIPCKCKCDCNCKYKDFAHDEKLFYENQKLPGRVGYISDKVDEEYEQSKVRERRVVEDPQDDYSTVTVDEGHDDESTDPTVLYPSDSTPNTSIHEENIYVNRSGHMRLTLPVPITTTPTSTRPEIRIGKRKLKEEAKSACARIAIGCGVSTKKARKALKIGCEELYGHKFYLSKEEQRTNEPAITNEETDSVIDKPSKWDDCSYVLPSEHTINDYISLLAAQEEADAGVALHEIPNGITATLHYDATTRNYIDGDWVSVLLRFSDKRIFDLRPIKFAYEDRDNIINFLEESYIRISTAASVKTGSEITPKQLWENTTFLCTDAVTKNHFIGEGISKRLNSNHVPIHVLCKSHTVEGIDKAVLKVLSQYIEQPLKIRNEFEKYNHALRSFFRHSTVVQAGMKALLKLVTPDKSANSCSLAEDFTQLCLKHGTEQKIVLYHERRFCQLGSCASVLLQALPMLELLLIDIPVDNLLAQACRLYLNCEVFITELRFLAYFNQEVTFPFLNCVEVSDTPALKRILPKLHQDLLNDDVTTLAEFKVKSRYRQVGLDGEFELKILHLMCESVAACIQLQCGREYGFPSNDDKQTKSRAADLTTISDDILADAPTENLITERRLSVFSRRSDTAKYSNKRHTGEMLRDNMVLHAADRKKLDECSKEIKEVLFSLNKDWNEKQHELQVKRLESKYAKKRSHVDYVKKLTVSCKSWGGPCCSRQEVLNTIRSHPDMEKTIIRTELSFYIHTHKADRVARPELFRLNGIAMEEQLENLCVLLSDDGDYASISSVAEISLPTNSDALHKLETPEVNYPVYNINAPVVNLWYENGIRTWYIGYFRKRISESVFEVEQLIRKESDQDLYWLYPQNLLTENIDTEQIMMTDNGKRFPVEGEWDLMGRANKLTLKNLDAIKKQLEKTAF